MKRILCCSDDNVLISEFFPGETVYLVTTQNSIYRGIVSQVNLFFEDKVLKFQYLADFENYGIAHHKTGEKPKFFKTREEVTAFVDDLQAGTKEKILGKYFESSSFQRKIEE